MRSINNCACRPVGLIVGVGADPVEGSKLGPWEGSVTGCSVGFEVGLNVGATVVGFCVGLALGEFVKATEGTFDGEASGLVVGVACTAGELVGWCVTGLLLGILVKGSAEAQYLDH